jgi:hypothetical protein
LKRAAAIDRALYPPGGHSYSIPLQATAYLDFGLAGIALAFVLVGGLLALADNALARPTQRSLATFLPLATLVVDVPVILRTGPPTGPAFLAMDVIGVWIGVILVVGGPGSIFQRVRASFPNGAA